MAINILTRLKIEATMKEVSKTNKIKTLTDGGGLYLSVRPNNNNIWEFLYQSPTQYKRRKRTFGKYPSITISQARNKAKQWNEQIIQGIDIIEHDKQIKEMYKKDIIGNFESVVNEWFNTQKGLNKRHLKHKKALFENHVIPKFKQRHINSITHKEVAFIIEKIAKKTPETASRVLMYCNQLWRYATTKEYAKINIIAGNIDKNTIIKRPHQKHLAKITDEKNLKALINSLYGYGGYISTKNALLFTMHLPLRASNVVNLEWSKINFEKRVITIPRHEMKNKNPNLPHCKLPLTDEVIKILEEQKKISFNKWVFSSPHLDKHINQESPNRALRNLGYDEEERGLKQTMHSFRGTFRSLADTHQDKHKQPFEIKEIALDHYEKNQAVLAYTHQADYEKGLRILFDWWSGFILNLRDKDVKK